MIAAALANVERSTVRCGSAGVDVIGEVTSSSQGRASTRYCRVQVRVASGRAEETRRQPRADMPR
jgi:hypothetical protein